MSHPKTTTRPTINAQKNERKNANASAKSKELHPNAQKLFHNINLATKAYIINELD